MSHFKYFFPIKTSTLWHNFFHTFNCGLPWAPAVGAYYINMSSKWKNKRNRKQKKNNGKWNEKLKNGNEDSNDGRTGSSSCSSAMRRLPAIRLAFSAWNPIDQSVNLSIDLTSKQSLYQSINHSEKSLFIKQTICGVKNQSNTESKLQLKMQIQSFAPN